jgi:hypothetical protein
VKGPCAFAGKFYFAGDKLLTTPNPDVKRHENV